MNKVFITTGDWEVEAMFKERGWAIANSIQDSLDAICFTGGADVNPFLYGERPHHTTTWDVNRDCREIKMWKYAGKELPKIGICRGSQFGNVMCGGTLWQNVDGHTKGYHTVKDHFFSGEKWDGFFAVSSTHHQMSRLAKDAILLASASNSTILEAEGETKKYGIKVAKNDYEDVEAFYYDSNNFLGVQFHPEYRAFRNCRDYFWDLVDGCFTFDKAVPKVL